MFTVRKMSINENIAQVNLRIDENQFINIRTSLNRTLKDFKQVILTHHTTTAASIVAHFGGRKLIGDKPLENYGVKDGCTINIFTKTKILLANRQRNNAVAQPVAPPMPPKLVETSKPIEIPDPVEIPNPNPMAIQVALNPSQPMASSTGAIRKRKADDGKNVVQKKAKMMLRVDNIKCTTIIISLSQTLGRLMRWFQTYRNVSSMQVYFGNRKLIGDKPLEQYGLVEGCTIDIFTRPAVAAKTPKVNFPLLQELLMIKPSKIQKIKEEDENQNNNGFANFNYNQAQNIATAATMTPKKTMKLQKVQLRLSIKKERRASQNFKPAPIMQAKKSQYEELISLEDNSGIIKYTENFECSVCMCDYSEGLILRNCLHTFCLDCVIQTIKHSSDVEPICPYMDNEYTCEHPIQDREIRSLLNSNEFEQFLARGLQRAEIQMSNTFHCLTVDCPNWCIYDDAVNYFLCEACKKMNCLTCRAIHENMNCKQFQEMLCLNPDNNPENYETCKMLVKMIDEGKAMRCPDCQVIIMKKEGCDWLMCSMCCAELCWVTRQRRWGPKGRGDTSGGCRCGVGGKRCAPNCKYCH